MDETEENVSDLGRKITSANLIYKSLNINFMYFIGFIEYELRKLERCRARSPSLPLQCDSICTDDSISPPLPLDLPVPCVNPDILCRMPDFKGKQRFLRNLGLESISKKEREGISCRI
jgi:hypothetical protein